MPKFKYLFVLPHNNFFHSPWSLLWKKPKKKKKNKEICCMLFNTVKILYIKYLETSSGTVATVLYLQVFITQCFYWWTTSEVSIFHRFSGGTHLFMLVILLNKRQTIRFQIVLYGWRERNCRYMISETKWTRIWNKIPNGDKILFSF